jgi:hypothetical protein
MGDVGTYPQISQIDADYWNMEKLDFVVVNDTLVL